TVCTLLLLRHFPTQKPASMTEVELMDDSLTQTVVHPLPAGDALPVGGWEAFSAFVSQHYSGKNPEKHLRVRFNVGPEGRPYNIEPQVAASQPICTAIIEALENRPNWQGKVGLTEIEFPE